MIDVLDNQWRDAILLELEVASIIRDQANYGWLLDQKRCQELIDELNRLIAETDGQIVPFTKPRVVRDTEVSSPFKKDGTLSERVRKYYPGGEHLVRGPFTKLAFETINLSSVNQLKEYLYSIGWEPDEWNEDELTGKKTSPKLTTSSLLKLGKVGELLDHRTVLTHRRNQLAGFLRNVRPDGRIEARANSLGASTHRLTHSIVVNVPKAKDEVFFGKEMRSVFTCPEDCWLVDYDAKGLEGRVFAHYLNDPDFTDLLLNGDWHSRIWGYIKEFVSARSISKNVFYALLYGAGDWQLGNTADLTPEGYDKKSVGLEIRSRIMAGLPAFKELNDRVKMQSRQGFILGLDGRKVRVRNEYAALNTLFQSAGAIIMKRAMVILNGWVKDLPAKKVGDFHDEGVLEVKKGYEELVKFLCIESVKGAGKYYNLNCPLDADAQHGSRWSEIH